MFLFFAILLQYLHCAVSLFPYIEKWCAHISLLISNDWYSPTYIRWQNLNWPLHVSWLMVIFSCTSFCIKNIFIHILVNADPLWFSWLIIAVLLWKTESRHCDKWLMKTPALLVPCIPSQNMNKCASPHLKLIAVFTLTHSRNEQSWFYCHLKLTETVMFQKETGYFIIIQLQNPLMKSSSFRSLLS